MSGFQGNNDDNIAIAGELLDGFDGSIPETIDNSDDVYDGEGGDDFVQAGDTNDTLLGGTGGDILSGGGGDDRIDGGAEIDSLFGQGGDDIFFITGGEDIDDIDGGSGFDTLDLVAAGGSGAFVDLAAGIYDLGAGSGPPQSIFSVEAVLGSGSGDTIIGGGAAETYSGFAGNDTLNGGDNNDTLKGGSGADTLNGDAGNDVIDGGLGTDAVSGGAGNDRFIVNEGDFIDDVNGGADSDTLDLSDITSRGAVVNINSNYRLDDDFGGTRSMSGIERVLGTQDNDQVFGSGGADVILGNGGDDRINGGLGRDDLNGGAGDDTFVMNEGAFIDDVDGESGSNTLDLSDIESRGAVIDLAGGSWDLSPSFGGPAEIDDIDVVIGTQSNDRVLSDFGTQRLEGEAGNDDFVMLEGKFIDDVDGGAGFDRLDLRDISSKGAVIDLAAGTWDLSPTFGGAADISNVEFIFGTGANDKVTGSAAAETIVGANGDDVLSGGAGGDQLIGQTGKDRLNGGAGGDVLDGGSETDTVDYVGSSAGVTIKLSQNSASGGDAIGDTLIAIENVTGSSFADTLSGNSADNLLNGSAGNDTLVGGGGNDRLFGSSGQDALNGGAGTDEMTGGADGDRFDFSALADSVFGAARDTITDFTVDAGGGFVDRLNFSAIDAVASVGGNQAFTFIGSGGFNAEGQIRAIQVGADTRVQLNTSGVAGAEMEVLLANFTASDLSFVDFIL